VGSLVAIPRSERSSIENAPGTGFGSRLGSSSAAPSSASALSIGAALATWDEATSATARKADEARPCSAQRSLRLPSLRNHRLLVLAPYAM
jgi:hypothetical protein